MTSNESVEFEFRRSQGESEDSMTTGKHLFFERTNITPEK